MRFLWSLMVGFAVVGMSHALLPDSEFGTGLLFCVATCFLIGLLFPCPIDKRRSS